MLGFGSSGFMEMTDKEREAIKEVNKNLTKIGKIREQQAKDCKGNLSE